MQFKNITRRLEKEQTISLPGLEDLREQIMMSTSVDDLRDVFLRLIENLEEMQISEHKPDAEVIKPRKL